MPIDDAGGGDEIDLAGELESILMMES